MKDSNYQLSNHQNLDDLAQRIYGGLSFAWHGIKTGFYIYPKNGHMATGGRYAVFYFMLCPNIPVRIESS
jgi:hypothetical protein